MLQGTALKMSTAYHKQTNGHTKVVNFYLETLLHFSWQTNHTSGCIGFHGLNIGISPIVMLPKGVLRLSMAENLF